MENEIRILSLEDSVFDAEMIEREFRNAKMSFTMKRVETREDFVKAIDDFKPAVILLDYKLPSFDGISALDIAREKCPYIPAIFVSGAIGEERAVEILKMGAADYVMKDRLSRLAQAINRAIHEYEERKRLKQVEEALKESEKRFRTITDTANDAIVCLEPPGVIHQWNKMSEKMFGYSNREAIGKDLHALIVPERYREKAYQGLQSFFQSGKGPVVGKTIEMFAMRKDGAEFPIELSISAMNINGCWQATGIIRDVTERKRVEEKQGQLAAILEATPDFVDFADAQDKHIMYINPAGRRMCGIGDDKDVTKLRIMDVHPEWTNKIFRDEALPTAIQQGVWTGECAFLHQDGKEIPVSMVLLSHKNPKGEVTVFSTISRDITERKEAANKLVQSYEKLRRNLEATAAALSSALEKRDAYTAGHQRRVTQLACAIAGEMGFSAEQTDGIRIAGILHDIGKISIPAELLSKPSKLNKVEFELIKAHTNAGYEILKNIEFPWSISQIVLQHHEKMDGSGYPSGLSGDKILMEARILCVADVVEAMASHRPYRAALGIDAAMEEITQKRGILYDPAVVDVCVRLFKEKGFKFE